MMHGIIYAFICMLHGGGGRIAGSKEPATGQFLSEKMAENSLVHSIATRENEEASLASSSEMDVELVDKG